MTYAERLEEYYNGGFYDGRLDSLKQVISGIIPSMFKKEVTKNEAVQKLYALFGETISLEDIGSAYDLYVKSR